MSTIILIDADFLSAFLKIGRLSLIRDFYQVEQILLPPAVYREIAQTTLLPQLVALNWLALTIPDPDQLAKLRQGIEFNRLGAGEQEAIALALAQTDSVLLMNDNKARLVAAALGVTGVNIPAFLLACKLADLVSNAEMRQIIDELWTKDYYKFRQDVQSRLLAE